MSGNDRRDLAALRGGATALQARPLSSFTPEQQRLLRALLEAVTTPTADRHPDGGPTADRHPDRPDPATIDEGP